MLEIIERTNCILQALVLPFSMAALAFFGNVDGCLLILKVTFASMMVLNVTDFFRAFHKAMEEEGNY